VDLLDRLGLEHPVVQAGMGGGLATAALAAAVAGAGGLGTVGMMAESSAMASELREAKEQAPGSPLAANLLVPFARRGHVEACLSQKVDAVVLFAGFSKSIVERLKQAGILVLHQVGTAAAAKRALGDGADGLIAQGVEAGGHVMGTRPALEVLQNVKQIARDKPVLLAGGVHDSTGTKAALDAGATAVVSGSRFLLTAECRAHPAYKARVTNAQRTVITELFGLGWPLRHRVVPNAATEKWGDPRPLKAFNRLTAPALQRLPGSAAARLVRLQRAQIPLYGPAALLAGMDAKLVEVMPLYAGECVRGIGTVIPAAEAVQVLTPR
jgi:NAD(P)H-dependent flavin oxidoreductase YrpB (nitropropane dioxygenase family)